MAPEEIDVLACSPLLLPYSNYIHKRYHNQQPKQLTRTFRAMGHDKVDGKRPGDKATTEDSRVGIQNVNLTKVLTRKRRKWITSYSNMKIPEAERRLNVHLILPGIPVQEMLEVKSLLLGPDTILEIRRTVYRGLVRYMNVLRYPSKANPDFKEANINDVVILTIYPILDKFKQETGRKLELSREKGLTSKDSSTSGMGESVAMDYISLYERKYILVVEAKKVSLGEARKQCFLTMKDMWDCNGGGTVYRFITMGDFWRMITFDGEFKITQGGEGKEATGEGNGEEGGKEDARQDGSDA
ncbi:hypothetical protein HOY82DRAFT_588833 [Tuber indicum]|nr:hypothetical protein HOY82DRAFT_588833 [Tuber indicum]